MNQPQVIQKFTILTFTNSSTVYELDELVQMAKSTPEDAQHIVNHLIKKLESKNPVVKAKVHSLSSTPISDFAIARH